MLTALFISPRSREILALEYALFPAVCWLITQTDRPSGGCPRVLERNHLIRLCHQISKIAGSHKFGVFTGHVLVGYPTGAGSSTSNMDRRAVGC